MIVPSADISPLMKQAIVAVEDKRFYEHRGVDFRGIGRAILADVTHKGVVEGGSTITQQFVKNTYLHDQRSIGRKLREATLAWQLEQQLDEGPDPHRLPEHDLLRQRRLRRPAGGRDVLPARRAAALAGRGGAARGDPERPEPVRPVRPPAGGARAAATSCCATCSTRATSRAPSTTTRSRPRSRSPTTSTSPATRGPRSTSRATSSISCSAIPGSARAASTEAGCG